MSPSRSDGSHSQTWNFLRVPEAPVGGAGCLPGHDAAINGSGRFLGLSWRSGSGPRSALTAWLQIAQTNSGTF